MKIIKKKIWEVRHGDSILHNGEWLTVHTIMYHDSKLSFKLSTQEWIQIYNAKTLPSLDKCDDVEIEVKETANKYIKGLSQDSITEYCVEFKVGEQLRRMYVLTTSMKEANEIGAETWTDILAGHLTIEVAKRGDNQDRVCIEICSVGSDGLLHTERRRSVKEVYQDLYSLLKIEGLLADLDYFSPWNSQDAKAYNGEFPPFGWIECSCVTGGSEGHYIHVRAIDRNQDGKVNVPVFLGKTFLGMSHGYKVAQRIAELLGA